MRIRAIHTYQFAALGTQSFDFKNDWDDKTASRILFSGRNGCGKSTLLKGVAMLWEAFGYWLHNRRTLDHKQTQAIGILQWLQRGGMAVQLESVGFDAPDVLLYWLPEKVHDWSNQDAWAWLNNIQHSAGTAVCLGQASQLPFPPKLDFPTDNPAWLTAWTAARQRMLVSSEPSQSPNILFLDAEERRWVTPSKNIGDIGAADLKQRWLASYHANESWESQLESALLTLKIADDARFGTLIDHMNHFLSGKRIAKTVILGENRLRVELANGVIHTIDHLSSGEHQVLIQLYMVERWLEQGGVVLIDEPDLYLHPSLISGFLARLEIMVAERNGQLLITSHIPAVWERYEAIGQRVLLGEAQP